MSKASSSLRTSLDAAKTAHETVRYPGDLAADLLMGAIQLKPAAQPVTTNRWFWAFGTSSAVAASLVTAFILTSQTPDNTSPGSSGFASQPARSSMGGPFTAYTPIPQFGTPQFQEISGRNVGEPAQFELVPRPIDPNRTLRLPFRSNEPGIGFASSPVLPGSAGTNYGPSVVPNYNAEAQPNFRPGNYTTP